MNECLQTKNSNCKNCYKCIRHCPVKSLKFTGGQAHIIRDECVLCGECYVVCPQSAKQIRNDVEEARRLIEDKAEVYVSMAPAFIARYNKSAAAMEAALKKLGFAGMGETAVGAAIVKKQYEKMVASRKHKVIISSCCHTVNTLIQRHFTGALPFLADVASPMLAHGNLLKKEHGGCGVVFIGPCISKKAEAEKYPGSIDVVLTFEELDEWLKNEGVEIEEAAGTDEKGRTRAFPTSGGILYSMDKDPEFSYVVADGMDNCINALKSVEAGEIENCFIEMSACSGSCIGGPVMKRREMSLLKGLLAIQSAAGEKDFSVKLPAESELKKEMKFEGVSKTMPGSSAINEILHKMGKTSSDKELNCGSCGYNTCREKAVAVFMGKADLSMCLPYLKDKAESFSDTIISNTPNGIIVLDESLDIQQINKAAKKILNLPGGADVTGEPVIRILDPVDYVMAMSNERNVYDKRKYLAEYGKYVEETVIYDKEYHIIMIIIKDVSVEEELKSRKDEKFKAAVEITDKVVEKQMRVVQEIASLLGETTAETKIALTKLKENLGNE